jgi:hypothetical protein
MIKTYDFSQGEIGKYAKHSLSRRGNPTNEFDEFMDNLDKAGENVHKSWAEVLPKNDSHKYTFVAKNEDVDYLRIIDETPANTPVILVEERSRRNQPRNWTLLISGLVLNNTSLRGRRVLGKRISPNWGAKIDQPGYGHYRYICGKGKFPGIVKQQIVKLLSNKREKDTLAHVSYLGLT